MVSMGLRTEIGWLLVCSSRDDFPTPAERLTLGVAVNQAVIALQQALLRTEQSRVAQELERKVREQAAGVPPHRWLLDRRVQRAKELLPDSKLSLSDVALACGFGDQSHFTRTFTAAVRLSPGVWRRLRSVP